MKLGEASTPPPILHFAEDDADWTALFCDTFHKSVPHWQIVHSAEGLSARNKLISPPATLLGIVTDINMPQLSGLELIEWIKAQPHLQSLPVFVLSSTKDPYIRLRCAVLEVNAYWEKPASVKELGSMILTITKECEQNCLSSKEPENFLGN